jgi:hypothetical protein
MLIHADPDPQHCLKLVVSKIFPIIGGEFNPLFPAAANAFNITSPPILYLYE